MKKTISILLLSLFQSLTFSQTSNQTSISKGKKFEDSIQFQKFKKENPENFLNKRLPLKLINGGYFVSGYATSIHITNTHISDSVYHNFIPGMPDTTTVNPFNDIKVTDQQITITLFSHLPLSVGNNYDSSSITPAEPEFEWKFKGKPIPFGDFLPNQAAIQISINGKLLFNWKPISDFAKQVYKQYQKFNSAGGAMYGYNYGYKICDTILNMNDQLLIEIKNTKNNWMIDRYNITRVGAKPFLAKVTADVNKKIIYFDSRILNQNYKNFDSIYFGYKGNGIHMTKDSILPASLIFFFFRKPSPDFLDSLQFKFSGGDTLWHSTTWYNFGFESQSPGDYELLVKYKNSPENIASYQWTVKPKWYQTNGFKIISYFLILILLISIVLALYKARIRKEKERRNKLTLELRSIQSQLNPHFIFNSLNSIQALINTDKIAAANEYLSQFSHLIRNTLTQTNKIFQTLDKEIDILNTYLKLEQLRFAFEFNISTDNKINTHEIEIPSLLLQPLVENAVKHGISAFRENGRVNIFFYKKNTDLIAEIKDNGKGFDSDKDEGYGWKLTNDRILVLNKMLKEKSIIKKLLREENNTIVQLIFKNWM